MSQYVSHEAAAEALDSLDDYARMGTGVDAYGPRGMLERYIAQQAATLRQPAARVDEDVAERFMAAFNCEAEADNHTRMIPMEAAPYVLAALEAALSAQPAPERQGECEPVADVVTHGNLQYGKLRRDVPDGTKLYTHPAAPVGVPADDRADIGRAIAYLANSGRHSRAAALIDKLLAAAPAAPQGTQQGEG